jgi:hypothetical protein
VATEAAKDIKETVGSGVDGVKDDIDEIWRYVVVVMGVGGFVHSLILGSCSCTIDPNQYPFFLLF